MISKATRRRVRRKYREMRDRNLERYSRLSRIVPSGTATTVSFAAVFLLGLVTFLRGGADDRSPGAVIMVVGVGGVAWFTWQMRVAALVRVRTHRRDHRA